MKKFRLTLLLLTFIVMAVILMSCDGGGGDSPLLLGSPKLAAGDFDTRRYILLAHGMGDSPSGWDNFAAAAEARGFTVLRTQVPPCGSIEERATALADYINDNILDGAKAKAVGHSLGGLDLRKIVGAGYDDIESSYYQAARKLSKVYTMATPHGGQFFADKLNIGACDKDSAARQDISNDAMAAFNSEYPYSNFSIDGLTMAFLAYHFQCWSCGGGTDCVVGTGNQTWEGAPTSSNTLSGKHSNDLRAEAGPFGMDIGTSCTNERDNLEEVLYPIINDAISGYVAPASAKEVRLVSMNSGKCIDVAGLSRDNTANVQQYACGTHLANQIFKLEEAPDDGYYFLKAAHSGKCLDVTGGSTDNRANIQQYDCAGVDNQKFKLEDTGNGVYSIKAKHSGKCLDVTGGSTGNEANIQQYSCTDVPQQNWRLAEATDKIVKIVSKKSGKVVDVKGNSGSNGANVHQWAYDGYTNQWFVMARMGEYYKIIAQNSGKCLDISGAGMDNKANLQLYDCSDVDNQKFTLEPAGDGYYWIKAKHSGKCLDLAGGNTANGANIQQYNCVGSKNVNVANQLWKIERYLWE